MIQETLNITKKAMKKTSVQRQDNVSTSTMLKLKHTIYISLSAKLILVKQWEILSKAEISIRRICRERATRKTFYGMPVHLISDISDHAQRYKNEIT